MNNLIKNNSVAIVGNAASILDKTQGKEIDSHDVVCRINKGILIKDYKAQGRKTTVWAYGDFSLVAGIFNESLCKNTVHLSKNKRNQAGSRKHTYYYYPLEKVLALEGLLSESPSSGLILLDLVYNSSPKNITLYGFDWKETPTWCNTKEENSIKNTHNWKEERDLVTRFYLKERGVAIK